MKKTIKLTESDLARIVNKVIEEQDELEQEGMTKYLMMDVLDALRDLDRKASHVFEGFINARNEFAEAAQKMNREEYMQKASEFKKYAAASGSRSKSVLAPAIASAMRPLIPKPFVAN